MLGFDADALADLYAPDGVHEFGFFTPGHEPRYQGREALRAAYRAAWASPNIRLLEIHDHAVHDTTDDEVIVAEWSATAQRPDGHDVPLAGVLVLRARDGCLSHVRDYMDVLGLAYRTGRLPQLAASLGASSPS